MALCHYTPSPQDLPLSGSVLVGDLKVQLGFILHRLQQGHNGDKYQMHERYVDASDDPEKTQQADYGADRVGRLAQAVSPSAVGQRVALRVKEEE